MRLARLSVILVFTLQCFGQEFRSILFKRLTGIEYQCVSMDCSLSTVITKNTLTACSIACLAYSECRTAVFNSTINECRMHPDISTEFGSLNPRSGIITLIANNERLLTARKFSFFV